MPETKGEIRGAVNLLDPEMHIILKKNMNHLGNITVRRVIITGSKLGKKSASFLWAHLPDGSCLTGDY